MTGEYVVYKAPTMSNTCTIDKQLEVMKWILDPDSRPYDRGDVRLTVRSASLEDQKVEQSLLTIQKMLELRDKIINNI